MSAGRLQSVRKPCRHMETMFTHSKTVSNRWETMSATHWKTISAQLEILGLLSQIRRTVVGRWF